MKRVLIVLLLLMMSPVFAMKIYENRYGDEVALVNKIGHTILNQNRIPYRISFFVDMNKKVVNAKTCYNDKHIVVYRGLLLYIDNDDELAAILAHEISHAVDYNQGALKGYFSYLSSGMSPKKYEIKADKRAVDYLVKAGYNPLGLITIGNKIFTQPRYDWYLSHPIGSKRLATVYEYIYTKYPEYLVQNEYKDNVYYQNFLLTSKENRRQFEQKVKDNSKRSIKYQ